MAKGSQGLTWLQMGLSPEHRVCSGCGSKLKLEQVWHWNGTDRTVFGTCCPAFSFQRDPGDEDGQ